MSTAPTFVDGSPPSRFKLVYFLYDETNGKETDALRDLTKLSFPNVQSLALRVSSIINGESKWTTWGTSVRPVLTENALIIGIGEAGSAAALLQERFPELNLSVIVINSATEFQQTKLQKTANRIALYSSDYPSIKNRCEDWPLLSDNSFDVKWLQYGILSEGGNLCKYSTTLLIVAYLKGPDVVETFSPAIKVGEYEAFA